MVIRVPHCAKGTTECYATNHKNMSGVILPTKNKHTEIAEMNILIFGGCFSNPQICFATFTTSRCCFWK